MVNYYSDMIDELRLLPIGDIQKIKRALHWSIAENEKEMIVYLPNFRSGEKIRIPHYEFSCVYRCFELP
jgi:hypothetical protein